MKIKYSAEKGIVSTEQMYSSGKNLVLISLFNLEWFINIQMNLNQVTRR